MKVGNLVFLAGHVDYEMTMWENPTIRNSIIGAIVGLVLILFLIVLCCIAVRRRRRMRKQRQTTTSKMAHINQFDDTFDRFDGYGSDEDTIGTVKKRSAMTAFDNQTHFPTLNTEKKPVSVPRPVHTLPAPSRKETTSQGNGTYVRLLVGWEGGSLGLCRL